MVEGDVVNRDLSVPTLHTMGPDLIEGKSTDAADHLDASRRHPHAYDTRGIREIGQVGFLDVDAELPQRRHDSEDVFLGVPEEEIDILGGAGIPMEGDGIAAHDDELNSLLFEQSQEPFELFVGIHAG